jgi:hypothetical protein
LNRCSIYGNKEAGKKLNDMLAMGCSKPWPDALEAITGQRQMDATAIRDYSRRCRRGSTSRTRASRSAGSQSFEGGVAGATGRGRR